MVEHSISDLRGITLRPCSALTPRDARYEPIESPCGSGDVFFNDFHEPARVGVAVLLLGLFRFGVLRPLAFEPPNHFGPSRCCRTRRRTSAALTATTLAPGRRRGPRRRLRRAPTASRVPPGRGPTSTTCGTSSRCATSSADFGPLERYAASDDGRDVAPRRGPERAAADVRADGDDAQAAVDGAPRPPRRPDRRRRRPPTPRPTRSSARAPRT